MPTRFITTPGQMSLEYPAVEFSKYAEESYYLFTDDYVIHYFRDGVLRYRFDDNSKALQAMFRQEWDRAYSATRCPKSEVEAFAQYHGWELLIQPFTTKH